MFTFRRPSSYRTPRRTVRLRLESFEERTVPAAVIGVNVSPNLSQPPLGQPPPLGNTGAVGPNHFVQFNNLNFTVLNKTGAQLFQRTPESFWSTAGVPTTVGDAVSQPRVVYDEISDRWFAVAVTGAPTGNKVLLARSDGPDPTLAWKAVSYVATSSGFGSFPTLAVDANGVYIGTGDFTSGGSGGVPAGSTMTSMPKAKLLSATPADALTDKKTVTQLHFPPFSTVTMGWSPQAVTNADGSDASATVLATHYTTFNLITHWEITGSANPNATFGAASNLSIPHNALPGPGRQPDGTRDMSGGEDDRYTGSIYQVGDLIYAVHAISVNGSGAGTTSDASTTNGLQLIVLRDSTNSVVTTATYFNPNYDMTFPSVAANAFGDIVLGFNRSGGPGSTNGNLGAYAVHARINPANPTSVTFLQEVELKVGAVNDYNLTGTNIEAWGPYTATALDPDNPFEFWTTQHFVKGTQEWGTQVSQVYISPRALSVTSPIANGTYTVPTAIPITVKFNGVVEVTGQPRLALNSNAFAVYTGGSGTDELTFTYTIGAGQTSPDLDYTSSAALDLNGGSINLDDAGVAVPAELALPAPGTAGSLGANKNIVIVSSAAATSVTSPNANGTYLFDSDITIQVVFDDEVNVTGSPELDLSTGGVATFVNGSGTNTLTFNYNVAAGHSSPDLDYASAAALRLNGGTITDADNGAPAGLTLPTPGAAGSLAANKSLVVDALAPHVTGVGSTLADGTYGVNQLIPITVTFNRAVDVTGAPQLTLNTGGVATFASGSGSTTLTFNYTVAPGHNTADLEYASASALTLNGGTIIEVLSGQNATLALPVPGATGSLGATKNIAIDTVRPIVQNVSSPTPNGLYAVGSVIDIRVHFDSTVVVTGTPLLALNSGGSASYLSGSNSNTLTFRYTVGSGHASADLDYASTTALTLNGGTIKGLNSADANLGLVAPGAPGSLSAAKAIVVDAVGPTVLEFRVLFGSKRFDLIGTTRVLPWMIKGIQVVFDEPVMTGNVRSLTGLTATRFTGLKTRTLTWTFSGIAKGSFNTGLAGTGLNALKDAAGNPVTAFTKAFDVLYGDFNGDRQVTAADETGIRGFLSSPYQTNPAGYNIFADLSGDGLVNLVDVNVTKTRRGTFL
jgi:hypothetical protein